MMRSFTVLKKFSALLAGVMALLWVGAANASPALDTKEKAIIPIAAFTASGEIEKLKVSLNQGLDAGLTINETKEVLAQLYAYAGFPRSLNGLAAFMNVVEERKSQGIEDTVGSESKPLPTDKTSLEFGTANQTKLIGQPVKGPLFDFSPEIDVYLKAHLFGDIFERDVLNWRQREIATIAALANIPGVNSQLGAHYNISMNNDISPENLKEFITVLKTHLSPEVVQNAQQVLDQVLKNK